MASDEEAEIRRTGEERLELNHTALTRIGGEWPEETKVLLDLFRQIASNTGDQMEGGEWDSRTITIEVFMRTEDMGEAT